jgi:hypothetical protein
MSLGKLTDVETEYLHVPTWSVARQPPGETELPQEYEAASGLPWHIVLQQMFLLSRRIKVKKYSIVNT